MTGKALLLVQEPKLKTWLTDVFKKRGHGVESTSSLDELPHLLARSEYTWVVLMEEPLTDALVTTIKDILSIRPYTRFIVVTRDQDSIEHKFPLPYRHSLCFMELPDNARILRRNMDDIFASFFEESSEEEYIRMVKAAQKMIQELRYAEAYTYAVEALKQNPSRPEALNILGVLDETLLDRKDALRYYRAALALDPGFEPARHNLEMAVKGVIPRKPVY